MRSRWLVCSHRFTTVIEVRSEPRTIDHGGVRLVAMHSTVVMTTPWFSVGAAYRRPAHVLVEDDPPIPIRDHTMIIRLVAVVLALLLSKGMRR